MAKQWVRQELKRNPIAEILEKAAAWVKTHREAATGLGITTFAAFLILVYFISQYLSLKTKAWERLAIAQSYAYAGKIQESLGQVKNLEEEFPRTDAAGFGILYQGDLLYRQGLYKEAAQAYQMFLERQKPKTLIPFALAGLGMAQEASGKCREGLSTDRKFLDQYGDHFLAPQIHLSLARCLEQTSSKEKARSAYERIGLLYPDTFWAQAAVQRLQSEEFNPKKSGPNKK